MKLLIGACLTFCLLAVASSFLLGGIETIDVTKDGVPHVIDWAASEMNHRMNSMYHHVLLDSPLVTRQVVNGLKYHLYMKLAPTSCRNNGDNLMKTIEDCPVLENERVQQCDVSVLDFRGKLSMTKFACFPRKSSELLGNDYIDLVPHSKPKNQHKQLLGQDLHDYIPHNILGQSGLKSNLLSVHRMSILGGDDTDYKIHQGDHCLQYSDLFQRFKAKYNRVYGHSKEEAIRFKIFCTNMDRVKDYQKMERGSAVYGATIFADISEEEFKRLHTGWKNNGKSKVWPAAEIPNIAIPDSFDWRDHDAVTPVKNQGSCGSCWAFSTTGNIEGQNAIKNKKLVSLSEQELVDCDKIDQGCEGGLPSQAYEALEELGGIEPEQDYSYEGYDEKCHFNKSDIAVKLKGAVNISQDEGEIAAWLAQNGPISIGINAFAMQFYFGGISHPWKIFCNPHSLDHGVLIVGYGVDDGEPFWIIKNSWGAGWGREGYYYVYRGSGVCGLNTMCTSAVVE